MGRGVLEIAAELDDARSAVRALEAELTEAQCDLAGVRVGDIIEVTDQRRPAYVLKVATVRFWSDTLDSPPRIEGWKRKKNGDWYQWPSHVYGQWRVLERASS